MATHVLLALLSTGPVGISDAVGATNATLVRRMIRSDGTLLKPARPIVARGPPPATASSSARHTIEDGLPADIDDWLDDLDSDVEELPGMTAEAPLAPLPSTRVPLEVT